MPARNIEQQKLRDLKREWSESVSLFIDDFLGFKKIFNGAQGKFHPERISLSKHNKSYIDKIAAALATDLIKIYQGGIAIVNAQSAPPPTPQEKSAAVKPNSKYIPIIDQNEPGIL
jgi:hypothetical protein